MNKTLLCSAAAFLPMALSAAAKDAKPNILIIFTDDQGYADYGFMGSKTNKTPVVDKLAESGTVFTDFYAQHVSGPSRSALLTGRYPLRTGGHRLLTEEVTIAEIAKSADYQTACFGKWEVSHRKEVIDQMPNAQGFDYYYGTLGANDKGQVVMHENNTKGGTIKDMSKLTKLYTDKAIEYIENRDEDKPFMVYLAHTMLHHKIGVSKDFIGTSGRGLYGDAVQEMDYHVGRLLETLDKHNLRENTLIIFTTDNGPWNQEKYYKQKGVAARYPKKNEIFWGDGGDLRDGKGSCYEGGSRVPCIISMPGTVPSGMKKDGLISTMDFMPTFAKMLGVDMRKGVTIDGVDQSKFIFTKSNKSARKTFCYLQVATIGHVYPKDFKAIRNDRWKLLMPDRDPKKAHRFLTDFGTNDYELYDLKNDISEKENLAQKYPKIVEKLKAEHAKMLKSFEKDFQAD